MVLIKLNQCIKLCAVVFPGVSQIYRPWSRYRKMPNSAVKTHPPTNQPPKGLAFFCLGYHSILVHAKLT